MENTETIKREIETNQAWHDEQKQKAVELVSGLMRGAKYITCVKIEQEEEDCTAPERRSIIPGDVIVIIRLMR